MPRYQTVLTLLAVALAAVPAMADDAIALRTLPAEAGAPEARIELTLDPAFAPSWQAVNVGRLTLTTAGGKRRIEAARAPERTLALSLPAAECALLQIDLGPAAAKGRADAWSRVTRAAKVLWCPNAQPAAGLAARRRAGALAMAKTGSRLELRPLLNPATARVGRDLPVRIYRDGTAQPRAALAAEGPGGSVRRVIADRSGIAVVHLTAAGPWRLRTRTANGGREALLAFEVAPEGFWLAALEQEAAQ